MVQYDLDPVTPTTTQSPACLTLSSGHNVSVLTHLLVAYHPSDQHSHTGKMKISGSPASAGRLE